MLKVYTDLPSGFLDAPPEAMEEVLQGPSLIHLPGRRQPPLFVSTLLHGNETSGIKALQRLLAPYRDRPLPRSLSLFIGNVAAARHGLRRLEGQPDYNRIWPGGAARDSEEARMTAYVVEQMRRRGVFASIDIHNNTGHNPHYACINRLEPHFLSLASLFSKRIVYFTRPRGVQSLAFAELCPAVTLECGQPEDDYGAEHAYEMIDAALHLQALPEAPAEEVNVYRTRAIVRVPEAFSFCFGSGGADLELLEDLERLNFQELPTGTLLACAHRPDARLLVENEQGQDVWQEYLQRTDGEIRTCKHVVPSMFCRDPQIVRQDCLGYFMERLTLRQPADAV